MCSKDMNIRFQITNKLLKRIGALSHGMTRLPTHMSWTCKNKPREDTNPTLEGWSNEELGTLKVAGSFSNNT